MSLKNIGILLLILVVIANIIALNMLPDVLVGFNLLFVVIVLAGVGYFYWQRHQNRNTPK